jgi:hypothetical protein
VRFCQVELEAFVAATGGYELRGTLPLPAAADWGTSPPSLVRFRQGFVRTYRTPTLRFENLNTALKDVVPQGI